MRLNALFSAIFAAAAITASAAVPKVIAHRGHWVPAGSAQNSIRSIVKADSINCFGSEFDVWSTSDGVLVVNHDRKFGGLVIEESPAEKVLAITLPNGEKLPTLDQYLDAAKDLDVKLICEMKAHYNPKTDIEAAKKIVKAINAKGLTERTEYITFSRPGLKELIKLAPNNPTYYLSGGLSPAELKNLGAAGADYHINEFRKNPQWIKEAHDLGLKINIWTVDDEADMKWCIDNGADFITTNQPERLFRLLW